MAAVGADEIVGFIQIRPPVAGTVHRRRIAPLTCLTRGMQGPSSMQH